MDTSSRTGSAPRWAVIGLLAVLAFALWLRCSGLDWLLPHTPEPDNVSAMQLADLESGGPPSARISRLRCYPYLLADLAWLLPKAAVPASDDLDAHLRAASSVTLRVRLVCAVFSSALVLLTWSLARRFAGRGTALLAAAFVATSLLHILFAQQARPHGIHATFALLAVIAALRMRERPSWGRYACAGLACGLAIATLQSGLATLVPLAAAHLLRERVPGKTTWWRIALPVAIVAALAYLFYPTQGEVPPGTTGLGLVITSKGIANRDHWVRFADLDGYGFVLVAQFLRDHDPALLVLPALGLLVSVRAFARRFRDRNLLVVLAYAIPYLIAIGTFHRTYDRFLLPLLPFLALLAALGVTRCAGWLAARLPAAGGRRAVHAIAGLAALAFPAFVSLKFASVRDAPDTVEQASRWITENVRPDEGNIVVAPALTLPLFHDPLLIVPGVPPLQFGVWVQYQAALPPSPTRGPEYHLVNIPPTIAVKAPAEEPGFAARVVEEWRPAYAVLEISRRTTFMKLMGPIDDELRSRGDRVFVAASEPEEIPRYRPIAHQDMPDMLHRLLGLECLGPRVEIWRMRR